MRVEVKKKFTDKPTIQRFAAALEKNHNVVEQGEIFEPQDYRLFPDGVLFTCFKVGELGKGDFTRVAD